MRMFALTVLISGIISCTKSPAQLYIEDFQQKYGNLENVEELIFYEDFTTSDFASRYDAAYHYYDFRSGDGLSASPAYVASDPGIRMKYDASVKYKNYNGIRTKKGIIPLPFKPGPTKSIYIRLDMALTVSGLNQYNKIILTLNPATVETTFAQEKTDSSKCSDEITGKGIAFVIESENSGVANRYLRIERMSGALSQFGYYDTNTSTCNNGVYDYLNAYNYSTDTAGGSTLYLGLTADAPDPYTNAGVYPKSTGRFLTLNPTDLGPQILQAVVSYSVPSEISYAQTTLSTTDLPDATLASYNMNEIEIKSDSTVIWKAYGKTYTFYQFHNSTGLDFSNGFSYISLKMQQDGLSDDLGPYKTKVRKIIVTLRDASKS